MSRPSACCVVGLVTSLWCACSDQEPFELIRAIPNPDPDPGERFGKAIAYSPAYEKYNFAVPVETDDPMGIAEAGAVYLFDSDTGDLLATLTSPAPRAGDHFGAVVIARSGLLIAAPYADVNGVADAGAVYWYDENGNLAREIPNPEPVEGDHFGLQMMIAGQGIAVRVPGPTGDGSIKWFTEDFGGDLDWNTISDPEPSTTQEFASTMYATRDALVIGSPGASVNGIPEAGIAAVYDLDDFTFGLDLVREIQNPAPSAGARFGAHLGGAGENPIVATVGGSPVLVVLGADMAETVETFPDAGEIAGFGDLFGVGFGVLHPDDGAGSVAIYKSGGMRTYPNPDPQDGDRFGSALDSFGSSREFISSPADDRDGLVDAGSVYVVHPDSSRPGSEYFLHIPSPSGGAAFGTDVVGSFVSAPGEDEDGVDEAGAVYMFEQEVPRFRFRIPNPEPGAGDRFGEHALAGVGTTFAIGALADDPGGVVDAGSVYLYRIAPE